MNRCILVKRFLRIFLGTTGVLCLGVLLLVGSSGYWLPWALPGLLRTAGVEVESVRRGSDGDLVLQKMRYGDDGIDLSLAEFRTPMPLALLWHGWQRNPEAAGTIRVKGLEVRSHAANGKVESRPDVGGPGKIFREVESWLSLANRWMPPVLLERIAWTPPDGGAPYVLSTASFRSREWKGQTEARGDVPALQLRVTLPADAPWSLEAEVEAWDLVVRGRLEEQAGISRLEGDFARNSGSGSYFLEWADGWLPSKASLEVADLSVPEGLGDLPTEVGTLTVESLDLEWNGAAYSASARVWGGQKEEEVELGLSLSGDFETVLLREFAVTGSWVRLTLDEPVQVDWEGMQPETPFRFSGSADLDGQDYFPARGRLTVTLEAEARPEGNFPLQFTLAGENVEAGGRTLQAVEIAGRFMFPRLEVDSLQVVLPGGSVAKVEGSADIDERTLSLRGQAHLEEDDLDRLVGRPIGLEGDLRVELAADGPWGHPNHSGTARVGQFTPPGMAPVALDLSWEGEGADRLTADLSADGNQETLRLRAEGMRKGAGITVRLQSMEWSKANRKFLSLRDPAELRLDLDELPRWPWKGLRVGETRWVGDGRELVVQWDPPGAASLAVVGLRAEDFSGWLAEGSSLPEISLEAVSLRVEDFEPALIADLSASGSWQPESGKLPIRASLRGRLDNDGVELTEIWAAFDETPLLTGELALPLTLHPWILSPAGAGAEPNEHEKKETTEISAGASAAPNHRLWRIVPGGEFGGSLRGAWSDSLRGMIQEEGGPDLEDVDLELSLNGTVESPEAHLELKLHSMRLEEEWVGADFPLIQNLQLDFLMEKEKITLRKGVLEARDSGVRLTGELPYRKILSEYEEGKRPDLWEVLKSLRADAELQNWNATVWKDRLPVLFRPQGKITGTVGVDPGLMARGELEISGFSLRPTAYSPTVENIHATLHLKDRQMRLEDAGASVGGGQLVASGTVNFDDWADPRYSIQIKGDNVPVARTPEMILRSDAEITFARAEGEETPLLQGDLRLRNSTFLFNIDPFAPNVETGPGNRPPYFSVEAEPFASWRCDLSIEGQDFLRVRSSIFSTELSASLRLTRTLREPLLLGSVRTDKGRIRFPGMSMRIEAAEAFITPEQPNLLQIEVDAIGQNRAYVVTLNASGSAGSPRIEFASTPALTNAQILRLLTTGSLEGGGAGAIGVYLGQALLGPGTGEDTFADRLSVEIGQEVTDSGRSTVEVIYQLNDRWSVEGEYDRFDTYNLNFVRTLLER